MAGRQESPAMNTAPCLPQPGWRESMQNVDHKLPADTDLTQVNSPAYADQKNSFGKA